MITIKIKENNNHLKPAEPYEPIVCGNENYCFEFEFSDDWLKTNNKIGLIIMDCKKTAVEFSGNTMKLPILPNSTTMKLVVMSAESETTRLVSSATDINLMPTTLVENIPEFAPLNGYVNEVLSNFQGLTTGTIPVEESKHSQTSDVANNVSNPNLLINGNFKINQRGQTIYTETEKYTVDRWKLLSGSVEVVDDGIILNGTILQKLEHTPNLPVVASSNAGTILYSNGAVSIKTNSATLITFAKLEIGTTPTIFQPRFYAEELALCQRYYGSSNEDALHVARGNSGTYITFTITLPQVVRGASSVLGLIGESITIYTSAGQKTNKIVSLQSYKHNHTNTITIIASVEESSFVFGESYIVKLPKVSVDAELY